MANFGYGPDESKQPMTIHQLNEVYPTVTVEYLKYALQHIGVRNRYGFDYVGEWHIKGLRGYIDRANNMCLHEYANYVNVVTGKPTRFMWVGEEARGPLQLIQVTSNSSKAVNEIPSDWIPFGEYCKLHGYTPLSVDHMRESVFRVGNTNFMVQAWREKCGFIEVLLNKGSNRLPYIGQVGGKSALMFEGPKPRAKRYAAWAALQATKQLYPINVQGERGVPVVGQWYSAMYTVNGLQDLHRVALGQYTSDMVFVNPDGEDVTKWMREARFIQLEDQM